MKFRIAIETNEKFEKATKEIDRKAKALHQKLLRSDNTWKNLYVTNTLSGPFDKYGIDEGIVPSIRWDNKALRNKDEKSIAFEAMEEFVKLLKKECKFDTEQVDDYEVAFLPK